MSHLTKNVVGIQNVNPVDWEIWQETFTDNAYKNLYWIILWFFESFVQM